MRIERNDRWDDLRAVPSNRSLVPMAETGSGPIGTVEGRADTPPLAKMVEGVHIRNMTPRQMANMSLDLYVGGHLQWDEYALLAFQPELHPDFDRTIGALTGEKAAPDRPRDFVADWKERLAFEQRHNKNDPERIERTTRIVTLFRTIENRTDLMA